MEVAIPNSNNLHGWLIKVYSTGCTPQEEVEESWWAPRSSKPSAGR